MDKIISYLSELNHPVLYETGGSQEFISKNIFDLTGYYAEEMRMNRDLFPGLINPEDYIETNFKIKNWHKNNEPGVLTIQFRFQSSNGIQMWIEDHLMGLNIDGKKYMRGIMMYISEQKIRETHLLQLRTIWREKEMADEKEREIVYQDIKRQLEDMEQRANTRKEKVARILNYAYENKIPFENIDIDLLKKR